MNPRHIMAHTLTGISALLRCVGISKGEVAKQPMFDMFKIVNGVYVGGIHMVKNTDWEMHPDGDEALSLLSGEIEVVLGEADAASTIVLKAGQSCVVPKGVWHRQIVHQPGILLFHTYGDTTQHRPYKSEAGSR